MRQPLGAVGENVPQRPKLEQNYDMKAWQDAWRAQLKQSRFYLDGVNESAFAPLRAHLQLMGVEFITFFETCAVTHVITRRNLDRTYPDHDVLTSARRVSKIKIWTVEKLERFMTSLLGHDPYAKLNAGDNCKLEQMLQNERLTGGPPDKDQWHRFGDNYLLVWDPTNRHKPVAHKEWPSAPPQIYQDNMDGVCPFIPCAKRRKRTWDEHDSAAKRRNKENSPDAALQTPSTQSTQTKAARPSAAVAPLEPIELLNDAQNTPEAGPPADEAAAQADPEPLVDALAEPVPAGRQATMRSKRYGEIAASGIQRNSATSALVSNAPRFQAPSRDFVALAKKEHASTAAAQTKKRPRKPRKPGFCENCYERFENIDDHILTPRHRRYASDEKNFDELDKVIRELQRDAPEDEEPHSSQTSVSTDGNEHEPEEPQEPQELVAEAEAEPALVPADAHAHNAH